MTSRIDNLNSFLSTAACPLITPRVARMSSRRALVVRRAGAVKPAPDLANATAMSFFASIGFGTTFGYSFVARDQAKRKA